MRGRKNRGSENASPASLCAMRGAKRSRADAESGAGLGSDGNDDQGRTESRSSTPVSRMSEDTPSSAPRISNRLAGKNRRPIWQSSGMVKKPRRKPVSFVPTDFGDADDDDDEDDVGLELNCSDDDSLDDDDDAIEEDDTLLECEDDDDESGEVIPRKKSRRDYDDESSQLEGSVVSAYAEDSVSEAVSESGLSDYRSKYHRPRSPELLLEDDPDMPSLDLPESSTDLLLENKHLMAALQVYEVLRHYRTIVRLSPFHFEDFCAALIAEDQSAMMVEIYVTLLRALLREDDASSTLFSPADSKDSVNISLHTIDGMTWLECVRAYLDADSHLLQTPPFTSSNTTTDIKPSTSNPTASISSDQDGGKSGSSAGTKVEGIQVDTSCSDGTKFGVTEMATGDSACNVPGERVESSEDVSSNVEVDLGVSVVSEARRVLEGATSYREMSVEARLVVLQALTDMFLASGAVRSDILSEGNIKYDDHCRACHRLGDLLCCETCPAVYHLQCLDKPLQEVPEGDWICDICKAHELRGVTDCMTELEKHGLLCRQVPMGYDRHRRKYWFICRRLFVESLDSPGETWYYSTVLQLDELLDSLDADRYERDLVLSLTEYKEDIVTQMDMTEELTKKSKGASISMLEDMNEKLKTLREEREEQQRIEREREAAEEGTEEEEVPRDGQTDQGGTEEVSEENSAANSEQKPTEVSSGTKAENVEMACSETLDRVASSSSTVSCSTVVSSSSSAVVSSASSAVVSLLKTPSSSVSSSLSTGSLQHSVGNSGATPGATRTVMVLHKDGSKTYMTLQAKTSSSGLSLGSSGTSSAAGGVKTLVAPASASTGSLLSQDGQSRLTRSKTGSLAPKQFIDSIPTPLVRNSQQDHADGYVTRNTARGRFTTSSNSPVLRPANFLYRLGCDNGYQKYRNLYTTNSLALNRIQHAEEREKKRHLSHKFCVEFSWRGITAGVMLGSNAVATLTATLLALESAIPASFMCSGWGKSQRAEWLASAGKCSRPEEFSLAMVALESNLRPVVLASIWNDGLGHVRLRRILLADREDARKKEREMKKKKDDDDMQEVMKANSWVKYSLGIKHSVWKQRGEDFRITGQGGWAWLSTGRPCGQVSASLLGLSALAAKLRSGGVPLRGGSPAQVDCGSLKDGSQADSKTTSGSVNTIKPELLARKAEDGSLTEKPQNKPPAKLSVGNFEGKSEMDLSDDDSVKQEVDDEVMTYNDTVDSDNEVLAMQCDDGLSSESDLNIAPPTQTLTNGMGGSDSNPTDKETESCVNDPSIAKQELKQELGQGDSVGVETVNVSEALVMRTLYPRVTKPAARLDLLLERRTKQREAELQQRGVFQELIKRFREAVAERRSKTKNEVKVLLADQSDNKVGGAWQCYSSTCNHKNGGGCYSAVCQSKSRLADVPVETSSSDRNAVIGGNVSQSGVDNSHSVSQINSDSSTASDTASNATATAATNATVNATEATVNATTAGANAVAATINSTAATTRPTEANTTGAAAAATTAAAANAVAADTTATDNATTAVSNATIATSDATAVSSLNAIDKHITPDKTLAKESSTTQTTINSPSLNSLLAKTLPNGLVNSVTTTSLGKSLPAIPDATQDENETVDIDCSELLAGGLSGILSGGLSGGLAGGLAGGLSSRSFYGLSGAQKTNVNGIMPAGSTASETGLNRTLQLIQSVLSGTKVSLTHRMVEELELWVSRVDDTKHQVSLSTRRSIGGSNLPNPPGSGAAPSGQVVKKSPLIAVHKFYFGRDENGAPRRSLFALEKRTVRWLARHEGKRECPGFNYSVKAQNINWSYPSPRPSFRTAWRYRTQTLKSLSAVAVQLRVFWACVRWDDLAVKVPSGGMATVTTEMDITTREVLDRREVVGVAGTRAEYKVRRIIVPIGVPSSQQTHRAEKYTPQRVGLRQRRRPESPKLKEPTVSELWVSEEQLELWQIKLFHDRREKLKQEQRLKEAEAQRQKLSAESEECKSLRALVTQKRGADTAQTPTSSTSAPLLSTPTPLGIRTIHVVQTPSSGLNPTQLLVRQPSSLFTIRSGTSPITSALPQGLPAGAPRTGSPTIQNVRIISGPNGQLQAHGLLPGQQLLKLPDGRFHLVTSAATAANRPTMQLIKPSPQLLSQLQQKQQLVGVSAASSATALTVTTPTAAVVGGANRQLMVVNSGVQGAGARLIAPMSSIGSTATVVRLPTGQHVLIRTPVAATTVATATTIATPSTVVRPTMVAVASSPAVISPAPSVGGTRVGATEAVVRSGAGGRSEEKEGSMYTVTPQLVSQVVSQALLQTHNNPDIQAKLLAMQKMVQAQLPPSALNETVSKTPLSDAFRSGGLWSDDEDSWDGCGAPSPAVPTSRSKTSAASSTKSSSKIKTVEQREEQQRMAACSQVLKGILDTIEKQERIEEKQRKRLESLEEKNLRLAQHKLELTLSRHKDSLKRDMLKKRSMLERSIATDLQDEIERVRETQRLQKLQQQQHQQQQQQQALLQKQKQERLITVLPTSSTSLLKLPVSRSAVPFIPPGATKISIPSLNFEKAVPPSVTPTKTPSAVETSPSSRRTASRKSKEIAVATIAMATIVSGDKKSPKGKTKEPKEKKRKGGRQYLEDESELYCVCRTPYDKTKFYIGCDDCEGWFHGSCVGVTKSEADRMDSYVCPNCRRKSQPLAATSGATSRNLPELNSFPLEEPHFIDLRRLITAMKTHKMAWPFLQPVSASEVPDYYLVIKDPMDLLTVQRRVDARFYKCLSDFIRDVMKIFDNCRYYNQPNTSFHRCAETLELFFVDKLKALKEKLGILQQ